MDILLQAGIRYRQAKNNPDEVMICCPFCGDDEFKFGLNLDNGKAHCFHGRCDWRSSSVVYTARELCKAWGIDFNWRLRLSAAEADDREPESIAFSEVVPAGLPPEFEHFTHEVDLVGDAAFAYLRSRGVTWAEVQEYDIGFAAVGKFAWRVLFPVIGDDAVIYGCVGRAFAGTVSPKYLNTEGIKILWNGQRVAKQAVVCEGVLDAIRVNRVLHRWFPDSVAVANLGSAITPQQIAQLAKFESMTQFPDFDAPGVKGAIQRAEACTAAGLATSIIEPTEMDGTDPGDMTDEMIAACLRSARPWTKMQKYRMRLAALR